MWMEAFQAPEVSSASLRTQQQKLDWKSSRDGLDELYAMKNECSKGGLPCSGTTTHIYSHIQFIKYPTEYGKLAQSGILKVFQ